jgi:hypothetical protein
MTFVFLRESPLQVGLIREDREISSAPLNLELGLGMLNLHGLLPDWQIH